MNKSNIFMWLWIDLMIQSFFVFLNLICLMSIVLIEAIIIYCFMIQFFLGIYQYFMSALPHISLKNYTSEKIKYQRHAHFYLSTFFLVIIFIMYFSISKEIGNKFYLLFLSGMFIIPQILMYFYYYITFKDYQQKRKELV